MSEILIQKKIQIKDKFATGIEVKLPNANWVLVAAQKGFVCCGYLDLTTAEKLCDSACVVRGVKTIDDLLKAKVVGLTTFAQNLGVKLGMTGKQAMEFLV